MSDQQYVSAVDDPVNQDRRNFQAWDARYGMMVEDASAMCAGVHDHGWQTEDEFARFMGEDTSEAEQRRRDEYEAAWRREARRRGFGSVAEYFAFMGAEVNTDANATSGETAQR